MFLTPDEAKLVRASLECYLNVSPGMLNRERHDAEALRQKLQEADTDQRPVIAIHVVDEHSDSFYVGAAIPPTSAKVTQQELAELHAEWAEEMGEDAPQSDFPEWLVMARNWGKPERDVEILRVPLW